jgi:hypothetical protein
MPIILINIERLGVISWPFLFGAGILSSRGAERRRNPAYELVAKATRHLIEYCFAMNN